MKKLFDYFIYSLAILLAFLLVFERYLEPPMIVNWLGHWHPLVLHFPIVLIIISIIQHRRKDPGFSWYLTATTFFTMVSAITGFLLSLEGGTKGDLILTHQWMGVGVAYVMVIWYYFEQSISKMQGNIIQVSLVILIIGTGHYGGMVTHGEQFLSFGTNTEQVSMNLPDDPNIYQHIVQPIFDRKCVSCHNENKAKGELVLTDFASLSMGGKSGSMLDGEHSVLARISLPIDDEGHMPPEDENQLEEHEFEIIKSWLTSNANEDLAYSDLVSGSEFQNIVRQMIEESNANAWTDLPEVSDEDITAYSSDYCTIKRLYNGSNALQVLIFPHASFGSKELKDLNPIAENIIELNLSYLPLSENELKIIDRFSNLEKLDISGSTVTSESIQVLKQLSKLTSFKLYDTDVDDNVVEYFKNYPSLSSLNIYATNITSSGEERLKNFNPGLNIINRSRLADEFKSVLPSPLLEPKKYFFRAPFYVTLDHPLDNIDIKFTKDGGNPDANSPVIHDSILVDKDFTLKYFAIKQGWESSTLDSIQFMRSGPEPDRYELVHSPDQRYLGIGKSLLFDLEKGSGNFGDDAWMAFRKHPLSLTCSFDKEIEVSGVTISSMVNTDPYLFPPSRVRVYGGNNESDIQLLGSMRPDGVKERSERHFKFYQVQFSPAKLKYLRIIVDPLEKIPIWHQGKGEKGWFFVDEVIISSQSGS